MSTLLISIAEQKLRLLEGETVQFESRISSAKNGVNCHKNSGGTPTGWHSIRAKIGEGAPLNTAFRGRRPFMVYSEASHEQSADWILSRIIWLSGLEIGHNRLGDVDTMQRYIYIHGTPDCEPMGTPLSHGCIRMRSDEVIALFDLLKANTRVWIMAQTLDWMQQQLPQELC